MKKLIIPIFMMFMLVGFASAGLEVISSSPVQFTSDNEFGQQFLMGVIENGGSERIYFSTFQVPPPYTLKSNSGYIEGKASNVYAQYPYTQRANYNGGQIWSMEYLNSGQSKWFLDWNSAQNWCRTLDSSYGLAVKSGILSGNYWCVHPYLVANVADIGLFKPKWTETFTIYNSITGESQNVVLSDTTQSGSYVYTPNRQVKIRYALTGGSIDPAVPDLTTRYSVLYQDSKSKTTNYIPYSSLRLGTTGSGYTYGYDSASSVYIYMAKLWMTPDTFTKVVERGETCTVLSGCSTYDPINALNTIRGRVTTLTTPTTISISGWTPTIATPTSASGTINLQKSTQSLINVFTIQLDADWVGVYQPVTKPVISSFTSVKQQYVEGDASARFKSVVKNEGTASGSLDYSVTCSGGVTVDSTPTQSISAGQTLTLYHNIYANTAGQNINGQCCLTVNDRSNPTIKSGPVCGSVTFLESNTCPTGMVAGSTSCSATNEILQCKANSAGVLVLQPTGTVCEYQCAVQTFGSAICIQAPTCRDQYPSGKSCGDAICETFERSGTCACPTDCSYCGDGICSDLERSAGNCNQDCGVPPSCGDGICSQEEQSGGTCNKDCGIPDTNYTLIILGIVGGLGIAGAIALRLRKEGYFGKRR